MRDLFAFLLKDVCYDVEVEPHLHPLTVVPTPLMRLLWMSARVVFVKGGNVHFLMSGFLTRLQRDTLTRKLTGLSRAMRTRISDTTTSELLKSSMAPSALSCSHHMVETVEKPSDFLPN